MSVLGLFSGIGGFELALQREGYECAGLCEIDRDAKSVLTAKFPNAPIFPDVRTLESAQAATIITAGFPCQDLSQAGPKHGIQGARSGLVDEIFRLLRQPGTNPDWVILENVSYMLKLAKGEAMRYILGEIEALGYKWAYRVIDARCFGLPQRRERVVLLLSKRHDPEDVLFPNGEVVSGIDDAVGEVSPECLYGFYWTEGKRGLGWTRNAVPTIKGGSSLGIPSPPAIWDPRSGLFGTPSIEDAERLCGFESGWTEAASGINAKKGARWKLVGNTICVPMVTWVAQQIATPRGMNAKTSKLSKRDRPPTAAFGGPGKTRMKVEVTTWVHDAEKPDLRGFLQHDLSPLSIRAASGFLKRARETTTIRFSPGFLDSLHSYVTA